MKQQATETLHAAILNWLSAHGYAVNTIQQQVIYANTEAYLNLIAGHMAVRPEDWEKSLGGGTDDTP